MAMLVYRAVISRAYCAVLKKKGSSDYIITEVLVHVLKRSLARKPLQVESACTFKDFSWCCKRN